MRRRLVRWGPALGLLGVGIVAVAALVTALAYSGIEGEPYGPLNHTVSELGERGVSELAALFNLGLLVGGVLVIGFMLSIALGSDSQAGRVFGVLGMLTGFAVILVGLFPVDDFDALLIEPDGIMALILQSTGQRADECRTGFHRHIGLIQRVNQMHIDPVTLGGKPMTGSNAGV